MDKLENYKLVRAYRERYSRYGRHRRRVNLKESTTRGIVDLSLLCSSREDSPRWWDFDIDEVGSGYESSE